MRSSAGATATRSSATSRSSAFTPNRVQAQDRGAAYFDRQEGMWAGPGESKIYFDCTTGGPQNLGQVWEYDPGRETLTLIYESSDPARLENPDNVVVVPQTKDILPNGPADGPAVTYAIYGPFGKRR